METKMSERDKVLLIVLAVIIFAFAAIMLPTVGIKDLIVSYLDTRNAISEQEAANAELLSGYTKYGIVAANANSAQVVISNKALQSKYDAVKFQQNSLSASSDHAVGPQWLYPVKNLHYEQGSAELFSGVSVDQNPGYQPNSIDINGSLYATEAYSCTMTCGVSGVNRYTLLLDYLKEDNSLSQLDTLLTAYNTLTERGSITVNSWNVTNEEITLELTLTTPADTQVDQYAEEIEECHKCGAYYRLGQYDKCTVESCGETLTHKSIKQEQQSNQ
jgi:hypothetical protein